MRKYLFLLAVMPLVMSAFVSCGSPDTSRTLSKDIQRKIDSLLNVMTLEEKVGQMVLFTSDWDVTGPTMKSDYLDDIRTGKCGNIFNAHTTGFVKEIQRVAVEESRLGIPVMFGYDVVHGHRTVFPISLGESCSWDMEAVEKSARVSAEEAAASGLNWTYAPMVDISVDPRWGRVSEGAGEDPYLGSRIAEARVRGFQGDDLSDPLTVLACVKHFAAYGAPMAGRDYNTVDMSERYFREFYLPPYEAAVDAGALSVMTSFNELDGVPATANHYLLQDLLRDEMGFEGFVVTDYTSINEMVHHGYAADDRDAAKKAVLAGVDMDLQGELYYKYLVGLVEDGEVPEKVIDDAVRRILEMKARLGLFDDPYLYCDAEREKEIVYSEANLEAARDVARKSMVLLKNDGTLPLQKGEKIAVIGELASSTRDLLGSWKAAGDWDFMKSIADAIKECNGKANVTYVKGCSPDGEDRGGFAAALSAAPGKPVAVVLLNGRPLDLSAESEVASAIVEAWYPGTMGAEAVTDVLFGEYNPSGKLSMTFPRSIGQVPIFYYAKNTGRPIYLPDPKYKSKYLDCPNDPLYPFGYGLSYTDFEYSDISLSSSEMRPGDTLTASVTVTNAGKLAGEEVVQLYIRDLVGSVTRPVKQLKGFEKISLAPGESREVTFEITNDMLSFYRQDMSFGSEPGDFLVFIGGSSATDANARFTLAE